MAPGGRGAPLGIICSRIILFCLTGGRREQAADQLEKEVDNEENAIKAEEVGTAEHSFTPFVLQ